MALKKWRKAANDYIEQYRIHHARPVKYAPPSLQLHARVLMRNGLHHRWSVGRYGYTLPDPETVTKKD